eukprot:SAG31_NODE_43227_length_268_cov_0.603550_1_plen_76_part_10
MDECEAAGRCREARSSQRPIAGSLASDRSVLLHQQAGGERVDGLVITFGSSSSAAGGTGLVDWLFRTRAAAATAHD